MKVNQLRSLDAIVRNDLSVTRAAESLHATQPGVTKHVQLLEAELGVALFVRHKKRFVALTPAGIALVPLAAKAVGVLDDLRRTARKFAGEQGHVLTVAISPTPARRLLPGAMQQFSQRYPHTRLHTVQGSVRHSLDMVRRGEADFCISSAGADASGELAFFPCYEQKWLLLVPRKHPLLKKASPSLADIAQYPIITYEEGFTSRAIMVGKFQEKGLTPNIVLEAADSDMMKRYVLSGVGLAIVGASTYDPDRDTGLAALDIADLIPAVLIHLGVRRDTALSAQARYFLSLFEPGVEPILDNLKAVAT